MPQLRFGTHTAWESVVSPVVCPGFDTAVATSFGMAAGAVASSVDTPADPFGATADVVVSPGVGVTGDIG